jgi:hypothetical protein
MLLRPLHRQLPSASSLANPLQRSLRIPSIHEESQITLQYFNFPIVIDFEKWILLSCVMPHNSL